MASKHEIEITAKIANLDQIRAELAKVKVNLNINSSDFKKIEALAKQGLTIDIKFKMPPEFQKLMDLQKNGININVGGGAKPITGGNTRLVSSEQALFNLAKTNFGPDKIQAHFNKLDAQEARELEQLKNARLKAIRRQSIALQKANEYVRENPLDALLGNDVRSQAASKFNVSRGSIGTRPNFFDPKRVLKGENFRDILFTTLLGGPGQGLGAAAGVSTFGKGGALIGANIAAATIAVFQSIADSMGKAVRAGAEYERAVTGITGIFQATSEVIGPGGTSLGIKDQLSFQGRRAEGIQAASQRALLPLGITGATGSALTQSLAAGLAQRGLAPDEKSTEILLRRFGASIQTLQPELASDPNLIRRGFEDIIGGGPQASRTELGSAIRGLAPGLFSKNIKSVDDIIKATAALEDLVVAIKNNDKATIEYQKALGSLQLAQQELGKGILEGLAPGLKAFNEELQKADASNSLKELGKAIGDAGTGIVKFLLPALQSVSGILSALSGGTAAATKAAAGDARGAGASLNNTLVGDVSSDQTNAVASGLFNLVRKRQGKGSLAPVAEPTIIQSIQSVLQTAKNRFGIEDPSAVATDSINNSGENRLAGLGALRRTLRKRLKSGEFNAEIGLNTQEIDIRRQIQQDRAGLFDSGDFGQQRRAISDKGALRDQIVLADDTVAKRRSLLKIEEARTDKTEESVAAARLGVQQAEEAALKLRNEAADKEKEVAEKRLSIFQKQLSAIDQTTFTGRDQALSLSKNFNLNQGLDIGRQISAQQAIISSKTATPDAINAAKDRLSELEIQRQSNQSATAADARQGRTNAIDRAAFPVQNQNRREAAADAAKKSELELQQLGISTKELTLEQNKLTRATADANKALSDFANQSKLRELGRQGEEIAAAEAIVAAGGTVPAGVSESLVRGSASFDPEARAAFEEQIAREKFAQVSSQNQFERSNEGQFGRTNKELQDNVTGLALDQQKLNLKPEEINLQRRALARSDRDRSIDNAKEAQAALDQDPENPQLQKEAALAFQKLQEAEKAVKSGEAAGAPITPPKIAPLLKKGSFSIDGQPVTPNSIPEGINISSGAQSNLIASNDIGNSILSGISGSAYGKARESTAKAGAIGEQILRGLGKDGTQPLRQKGEKDVNDGKSVFDDVVAQLPSKQDFQDAMIAALNTSFT